MKAEDPNLVQETAYPKAFDHNTYFLSAQLQQSSCTVYFKDTYINNQSIILKLNGFTSNLSFHKIYFRLCNGVTSCWFHIDKKWDRNWFWLNENSMPRTVEWYLALHVPKPPKIPKWLAHSSLRCYFKCFSLQVPCSQYLLWVTVRWQFLEPVMLPLPYRHLVAFWRWAPAWPLPLCLLIQSSISWHYCPILF